MVFSLAMCSFSDNFQSTRNVFQWSLFCFVERYIQQLGDQSNLHSIPSPTSCHQERCSVPKIFPQGNAVPKTGNSSFHED